jgi:hypothetical protein
MGMGNAIFHSVTNIARVYLISHLLGTHFKLASAKSRTDLAKSRPAKPL